MKLEILATGFTLLPLPLKTYTNISVTTGPPKPVIKQITPIA